MRIVKFGLRVMEGRTARIVDVDYPLGLGAVITHVELMLRLQLGACVGCCFQLLLALRSLDYAPIRVVADGLELRIVSGDYSLGHLLTPRLDSMMIEIVFKSGLLFQVQAATRILAYIILIIVALEVLGCISSVLGIHNLRPMCSQLQLLPNVGWHLLVKCALLCVVSSSVQFLPLRNGRKKYFFSLGGRPLAGIAAGPIVLEVLIALQVLLDVVHAFRIDLDCFH